MSVSIATPAASASADAVSTVLDLRHIVPRERHALIFARFDALAPGEALMLVNDHDPRPLHLQFEQRSEGAYAWTYLEAGPVLWRIRIDKRAAGEPRAAGDSCCSGGACCG